MTPDNATPDPLEVEWPTVEGDGWFDEGQALAVLLQREICFLNSHWWEMSWSPEARETISVSVNCNDFFAPAADAEGLPYNQIEALWKMWRRDPAVGHLAWCITRRGEEPWCRGKKITDLGPWKVSELLDTYRASKGADHGR